MHKKQLDYEITTVSVLALKPLTTRRENLD